MTESVTLNRAQPLFGLDLVRSCAILFVISGHFFLHTHLNETPLMGASLFIQACAQFFFGMGVPLFLLLTGYLNGSKTVSASYYKKAIPVLGAYLFFSLIALLFRKYYLGEESSFYQWIDQILRFSAIPYGWYIEMWIGLFLLTPFLNILYRNIPTQKQKRGLLLTLYVMTAVPDLFNRYGYHVVPGFWADLWPLTFYFLGAYIHEYKPRCHRLGAMAALVLICLINPVFTTLLSNHKTLIHIAGDPGGVFGTVIAVLFFLLFYRSTCRSGRVAGVMSRISRASLDMYLCCYLFDSLFYPFFKERYFESQAQFGIWFFILVPILFTCSFAAARMKQKLLPKL